MPKYTKTDPGQLIKKWFLVKSRGFHCVIAKTEVELVLLLLDDPVYKLSHSSGGVSVHEIPDLKVSDQLIKRSDLVLGAHKVATFSEVLLKDILKKMSPKNRQITHANHKKLETVELILKMEKVMERDDVSEYFSKIPSRDIQFKLTTIAMSRWLEKVDKEIVSV